MEWCDNPFYLVKFVIASSKLGVFLILILVLHNTDQHLDLFLSWFLIAFDNFEADNLVFLWCFVCATLLLLIDLVFGITTLRINSLIHPITMHINANEPFWPSPQVHYQQKFWSKVEPGWLICIIQMSQNHARHYERSLHHSVWPSLAIRFHAFPPYSKTHNSPPSLQRFRLF